jgi:hypothetical protein
MAKKSGGRKWTMTPARAAYYKSKRKAGAAKKDAKKAARMSKLSAWGRGAVAAGYKIKKDRKTGKAYLAKPKKKK